MDINMFLNALPEISPAATMAFPWLMMSLGAILGAIMALFELDDDAHPEAHAVVDGFEAPEWVLERWGIAPHQTAHQTVGVMNDLYSLISDLSEIPASMRYERMVESIVRAEEPLFEVPEPKALAEVNDLKVAIAAWKRGLINECVDFWSPEFA